MKIINLTYGKIALVDDKDYDFLSTFKWRAQKENIHWYAVASLEGQSIKMHWLIMPLDKPFVVDHADGNGLNNQRSNLRKATPSQNCQNRRKISSKCSSPYKGVHLRKSSGTWIASIQAFGKSGRIYLGDFKNEKDAAFAYDRAAKQYFGEFAKTNLEGENL